MARHAGQFHSPTSRRMTRREYVKGSLLIGSGGALAGTLGSLIASRVDATMEAPSGAKPKELVFAWPIVDNANVLLRPTLERWQRDYGVPYRWVETPNVEEEV